jgi:hypothetical protein
MLSKAKTYVSQIRYSGDFVPAEKSVVNSDQVSRWKDLFYGNDLAISEEVTPLLYSSLSNVLSRLKIEHSSVEAFVYSSPVNNAECYLGDADVCVIRFSSSLIDLLTVKEFEFVAGHEIGHFLCEHGSQDEINSEKNLEVLIAQRAKEISADRVGLLACASLDVSLKALIKTMSGLNDRHLRFDISSFISQLNKIERQPQNNTFLTHPSMLVRCRALLWFSISPSFVDESYSFTNKEVLKLDESVTKDLDKYIDSSARKKINDMDTDIYMWRCVYEIVAKGAFSKSDQLIFRKEFGENNYCKVLAYVEQEDMSTLLENILTKVAESENLYQKLAPTSFNKQIIHIKRKVTKLLNI